jgi:hemolysin activation/secretion protein
MVVILVCFPVRAGLAEAPLNEESLQASGASIGRVTVSSGAIFDIENPEEDKPFYHLLNKVHVNTRPDVIRQQLLFEPGEPLTVQAIEESERILRSNRYIQDAHIVPVRAENGVVDLAVDTSDTWTLMPKLSYSRSGGTSKTDLGITELNLLGTGIQVEALYSSDVDRDSIMFKLVDHHIGDSWYGIKTIYQDSDDGQMRLLDIGKPFHALDSRTARGLLASDFDRVDTLYDRGEAAAEFRHRSQNFEVHTGWSKGLQHGWVRRYTAGLAYDAHEFSALQAGGPMSQVMPEDRELLHPFVGIEILQDKFVTTENVDQIARTEDYFLGTSAYARLGLASKGAGSDRDAWLMRAGARTSFGSLKTNLLTVSSEFATRYEAAGLKNLSLLLDSRFYRRQSEKRVFYARLSGTYGKDLDLDQQLFLGGDSGLRGYPLRYQTGDKAALLTLEQRFYTDWYPFRLVRVGAAVFFDAGRTWGESVFGTGNDGLLTNIGVGLRLGSTRSGLGRMAHIDVAYPLDGNDDISDVQLLVSLKKSF